MLLKPDMFAKVMVSNEEGTKALCIPAAAVVQQDGKNYVVVYRNDSDLKVAQINLLKTVDNKTYISGGLLVGDKLISKNQILIFNQLTTE